MASGLGKTVYAVLDFLSFWESKPGSRLLFLCNQNDILEQAKKEFERVLGNAFTLGLFHGQEKTLADESDCLFASFQTMRSWRNRFSRDEFDFVVVDESHHTHAETYLPTVKYFRPQFLLAITATPDRRDLRDIRSIYGREIFNLSLAEAWGRGLLTPVRYRVLTDEITRAGAIRTASGKILISELNSSVFVPRRDREIARIIDKHTKDVNNPHIVVFCKSIAHCNRLELIIPGSMSIHSQVEIEERRRRTELFRKKGGMVFTVDMFNEGIDLPSVNTLVFLRSTASPTVFYQQLGRSLRKSDDKTHVTVLDLVGNIERIRIVQKLIKEVEKKIKRYERNGTNSTASKSPPPLEVDVGKIRFEEREVSAFELLRSLRAGELTQRQEQILQQLLGLVKETGRAPSRMEVSEASKARKCVSLGTILAHFGSYSTALKTIGVTPNKCASRRYSKETLVGQLQALAKQLGRTPRQKDIQKASMAGTCAAFGTFTLHFGKLSIAQRAAGLEPNHELYTRDELLRQYRRLAKILGRTPSAQDVKRASERGECASMTAFHGHFNSIEEVRRVVGLSFTARKYTKERLISQLLTLNKGKRRAITQEELAESSKSGLHASPSTFAGEFGSFTESLRAAGLTPKRGYSQDVLADQLRQIARDFGRVPSLGDIDRESRADKCASRPTFIKYFGSFGKALEAAGLGPGHNSIPQ